MERMPASIFLLLFLVAVQTTFALSIKNNPYQYSAAYTDEENQLQYLDARYYSPEISRFVSRDSYQLLNRYNYVDGNPINYSDPSGHIAAPSTSKLIEENLASMTGYFIPYAIMFSGLEMMSMGNFVTWTAIAGISGITSYTMFQAASKQSISSSGIWQNAIENAAGQGVADLQERATASLLDKKLGMSPIESWPHIDWGSQLSYIMVPNLIAAAFGQAFSFTQAAFYTLFSMALYCGMGKLTMAAYSRSLQKEPIRTTRSDSTMTDTTDVPNTSSVSSDTTDTSAESSPDSPRDQKTLLNPNEADSATASLLGASRDNEKVSWKVSVMLWLGPKILVKTATTTAATYILTSQPLCVGGSDCIN